MRAWNALEAQRHEAGVTLVEAVFAVPLFLVFVIITAELLLLAYRTLSIQFVAAQVMREAVLEPPSPLPPPATTYAGYLKSEVIRLGAVFGLAIHEVDISICPVDAPACAGDDAGHAEDLIRLSVTIRPAGLFIAKACTLAFGRRGVTATAISRNEWRPAR
jgi:hypothetical protein